MAGSQILVSRRNLLQDVGHPYVVFIDGRAAGVVSPYRTARFEVEPGRHHVWARLPEAEDTPMGDVYVEVRAGGTSRIATTSRMRRLSFGQLMKALGESVLQVFGREWGFPVAFSPAILLREVRSSDGPGSSQESRS